jgi:protein transport protein SEC24
MPIQGHGSLSKRDNPKLYNSEKAVSLFQPKKEDIYNTLGNKCIEDRVSFDLFICSTQADMDIASIAPLMSKSGGDIFYYKDFNAMRQGEKLHYDLFRVLTR